MPKTEIEKNYVFVYLYLGHAIIHRDGNLICCGSQFSGEVWSSLSEEPQKKLGEPLSIVERLFGYPCWVAARTVECYEA